jgi:membrane-associated phospholipid phosphatase
VAPAAISMALALLASAGGPGRDAPATASDSPATAPDLRLDPPNFRDAETGARRRAIYELHPAVDAAVLTASVLAIAVPSLFASQIIDERCPCDPSTVNRLDRHAIGNHDRAAGLASDTTTLVAMVAPPVIELLAIRGRSALVSDLVVYGEVLLVNGALTEIAKYTVQRPLPRTYAGEANLVHSAGGYRSFYSGHTSTTFAALSAAAFTLRQRAGERVWPWLVVAGVGTSVAVERVADGRHFPTDVIAGAVMGTLVGVGVPWLHLRHDLRVVPARGGLGLAGRF